MSEKTESGATIEQTPVTGTPEQGEAQADSATNVSASQAAPEIRSEEQTGEIEEHPKEAVAAAPDAIPHGRFNACFNGLSKIGPLALLAALVCMAWPAFWQPLNAVYCPAEIKSVTAFLHSIASSSWLAPTGLDNGVWSAAQWPVFSWVTGLIALSPGLTDSGYLLPTVTFLCAFFAVLGVWSLCHAAGFGYRAAFASGLILLCCPAFAPLPAFVGPAALASGLLLFALVFFCRGWSARNAWFSLPVAFVLTAFAFLSGGWFFLATPLVGSVCFLAWRAEFRRAQKLDAIFGFILLIAIIGIWLGWLMLGHVNDSYLSYLFANSWHFGWPIEIRWLAPVAIGILGTLPWLLMVFGVSWVRVLGSAGKSLSASRHDNGSALIWICIVIALPIAICTSPFHPAGIAIACLATTLLGKAMINLGNAGNRFFCLLAAICLIAAGAILLGLSFAATQQYLFAALPDIPVVDLSQKLQSLSMLPIIGVIALAGGLLALMFVKRFSGAGPMIYAILFVIILCQPCRLKLVPELAAMPDSPLASFAHVEGLVMDALATPVPDKSPESLPSEPAAPDIAPLEPPAFTPAPEAAEPAPEIAQPQSPPVYKMPAPPVPGEAETAQPEAKIPEDLGSAAPTDPQQETAAPENRKQEPVEEPATESQAIPEAETNNSAQEPAPAEPSASEAQ
ncbi:MAG: hypothetical protein HDQ91_06475 [Desulfovibrio sp.]|nr:hypothetical protein [Desulfovibrio sp.]